MTELPPDDTTPDDATTDPTTGDGSTDPAALEVRHLLRTEQPTIDPATRERSLAAAMAAVDEPPLAVDPALPRPVAGPTHDRAPGTVPDSSFTARRDERRDARQRVLAIAAAIVVVLAGAAVITRGGLFSSSSESADSAAESTAAADAGAGGTAESSGTADVHGSESSGGAAAEPDVSSTIAPPGFNSSESSRSADIAGELSAVGVADLGAYEDLGALFAAADALDARLPSTAPTDDATRAAADALVPCRPERVALVVGTVATATFRDSPVLVIRSLDPTGRPLTTILNATSCGVVAQG